jgi:hypothetical protein
VNTACSKEHYACSFKEEIPVEDREFLCEISAPRLIQEGKSRIEELTLYENLLFQSKRFVWLTSRSRKWIFNLRIHGVLNPQKTLERCL